VSLLKSLFKWVRAKRKTIAKTIRIYFAQSLYVSLGENCLTDDILKRHNLKSFSTPYSSGRTNIDYVIQLETMDISYFLNTKYLEYGTAYGKRKVVKSKLITACSNMYVQGHREGFEFTHHDVIAKHTERTTMKRRILRMRYYRGKKKMCLFYHYRYNENADFEALVKKMNIVADIYNSNCMIVIFTQNKIERPQERAIEHRKINDIIHLFIFNTYEIWAGDNQDIFWARIDDDLITTMINQVKDIMKSG